MEEDVYTFDYENPEGIISSCIDMAIKHIYNGKYGLNFSDFINEFESYWSRIDEQIDVESYIKVDESIRMIKAYVDKKILIYENDEDLKYFLQQRKQTHNTDCIQNAIYIALENSIGIFPPRHNQMWKIEEVRRIIRNNLSKNNFRHK